MLFSGKQNFRQMEKKILDSIIGDSTYDSRIRPSGLNMSDNDGMYPLIGLPVSGEII